MAQAPEPLFRLVFACRASPACEADMDGALADILAVSIPQNRQRGVTSLLIAHRGWFIQAAEGPEPEVREVFDIVRADERCSSVQLLVEGLQTRRMFSEVSMGARALSSADTAVLKGYDEAPDFNPAALPERALMRLLAVVAEAHHHRLMAQQRMLVRRL